MRLSIAVFALVPLMLASGQEVKPKEVKEIAKGGANAIPRLTELLRSPGRDVRLEVVRQLTEINHHTGLDALAAATRDNDPEVQGRAVAGLVNFYYPGYVQTGIGGSLKRLGTGVKGKFTDVNDQVVEPYVVVRPEVISALARLATGGGSLETRAQAAKGLGVLRGAAALESLLEAVHSKDSSVIYEALVALQKIRDGSAGPRVEFRLNDLDEKVQLAAIETVGLLRDSGALPALGKILANADGAKVKRAALTAIARMPDENSRALFAQHLRDTDERLRGAAAEGYGRLANPLDLPALEAAFKAETKASSQISMAFAMVKLGRTEVAEFSPLQTLVNRLNSASYSGEAYPLLAELARDEGVRKSLYAAMATGTKDEKIGLARVMAHSGDRASVAELERLTRDPDAEVAQEGLQALRTLQARL